MDVRNVSPIYWTSFPIEAAAQKKMVGGEDEGGGKVGRERDREFLWFQLMIFQPSSSNE